MDKKIDITYPMLTITFPNFNGGKEPLECIASIHKLQYPQDKIEIIVIDNNSTDGSDIQIKRRFPKVKLIKNKENTGFAKAVNSGIKKSAGQYIFIGNDDIVFGKKSITTMIAYMEKNPNVGITGGKIYLKNDRNKVVSSGYTMNKWTGHIYTASKPNLLKEPDWVQGCAMLIKKTVLKKIGIFDDNFSLIYFEDFDLCLRTKKAGYKTVYLPTAHFWHGQSTTADKNLPQKYFQWYKNKIRFVIKNLSMIHMLSILLVQICLITPYRAVVLHDGRFTPLLKGLTWNIIHLSQTLSVRGKQK